MSAVPLPIVVKEVRALLPLWAASLLTVAASAATGDRQFALAGILAYVLGSIALGAQSFGHEYAHGTLATLLAQPMERRRTFAIKYAVLILMLTVLGALYAGTHPLEIFVESAEPAGALRRDQPMLLLAALCGLCVAPWLAMACRSALAAIVFTVTLPLVLVVIGDVIGVARYGLGAGVPIDRLKMTFAWWGTLALCAAALARAWRAFARLEARDGGDGSAVPFSLPMPRSAGASAAVSAPSPLRQLVRKELRLQQLTFVLVGLFAVLGAVVWLLGSAVVPTFPNVPVMLLSYLYFGMLSILIGALASAEERQLGTREWQLLLPVAAWKQWAIKTGVVLGLAVVLGALVPAVVIAVIEPGFRLELGALARLCTVAAVLASCSLYVSTLNSSGVRAVVWTVAALFCSNLLLQHFFAAAARLAASGMRLPRLVVARDPLYGLLLSRYPLYGLVAGLVVLFLWLGYRNHRFPVPGWRRAAGQAAVIAGYLVLFALVSVVAR